MREKVARAIHSKTMGDWDALHEAYRSAYFDQADAVLGALMEPTEGMEFVGGIKCEEMMFNGDPDYSGVIFEDMGTVFRAMIQAAKEGK